MKLLGGVRPIVKPKPLAITPKHSKDQVKILLVEANRVRYSTHIDNFYFVRYAKIQYSKNVTNAGAAYFVCIFGRLKETVCQRLVYLPTEVRNL